MDGNINIVSRVSAVFIAPVEVGLADLPQTDGKYGGLEKSLFAHEFVEDVKIGNQLETTTRITGLMH